MFFLTDSFFLIDRCVRRIGPSRDELTMMSEFRIIRNKARLFFVRLSCRLSVSIMLIDDTASLSSIGSSSSASLLSSSRQTIDQNTPTSTASSTSLLSSISSHLSLINTSSSVQPKVQSIEDIFTSKDESIDAVKERVITKIDPVEMTDKPIIVIVPQNIVRRSAMLLSGLKFRLNSKALSLKRSTMNSNTIYSISVSTTQLMCTQHFFDSDCCRYILSTDYIMETNIILFFRFNGGEFIRHRTRVYMDSNVSTW